MTEAKQNDDWFHTAHLMALLANINRDPKKDRKFTIEDFHPLLEKPRTTIADLRKGMRDGQGGSSRRQSR